MDYANVGGTLIVQREITPGHHLALSAEEVRRDRTGVHARATITMNQVTLAWSVLNVEKDEDRVRLVNSAWGHINANGVAAVFPKPYLKYEFDQFCQGLWQAHLQAMEPEEMAGDPAPKPPLMTLDPYVIAEGGTIVFAPPGRGKSYTAYLMGVSVDAGVSALWPVRQTRTLLVNLERARPGVRSRLGNVNRILGLPMDRPLLTMNARGKSLADVYEACKRAIAERGVGFLVLDSISRAGMGDLNENQSVNRIMDMANALCPTWLALAHTPRKDESHIFGGMHFDACADVTVRLTSQQDEGGPLGVGLMIDKTNDVPKRPMQLLAFEFGERGLETVRRAKAGEFPDVEAGRRMSMKQTVIEWMRDNSGKGTAGMIADDTGHARTNVSRLLTSETDAFVKLERDGAGQWYGLIGRSGSVL